MRNWNKIAIVCLVLLVGTAIQGLAWRAETQGVDFRNDVDFGAEIRIKGTNVTATAAELNILDGVTATTAEINSLADVSAAVTTATLTNGAALTLSASTPTVILTGTGGANDTTNTVTIALPYPVGYSFLLVADSATTNLIEFADSTTQLALGSNVILDGTDTLLIRTIATNVAVKIATGNN